MRTLSKVRGESTYNNVGEAQISTVKSRLSGRLEYTNYPSADSNEKGLFNSGVGNFRP